MNTAVILCLAGALVVLADSSVLGSSRPEGNGAPNGVADAIRAGTLSGTSACRGTPTGWRAEFRIPLSQLRFPRAEKPTFGFAIMRQVGRLNETTTWPPPVLRRGIRRWQAARSGGGP